MISGNSYRMKTGREAFEQEQFVSIYDSNFGGPFRNYNGPLI